MGALRSCISRFDPAFDLDRSNYFEYSSFVGCSYRNSGFVFVGSLASAGIGPYLAFGVREKLDHLGIFVASASVGTRYQGGEAFDAILGVLQSQCNGFSLHFEVLKVLPGGITPVPASSQLEVIAQDRTTENEFMRFPGAKEAIDLFTDSGCEVCFIGDMLIATYLGLEVGRTNNVGGQISFELGVGRNDRMAKSWLGGSGDPAAQLSQIVEVVRRHRLGKLPAHPLASLGLARWMRLAVRRNPYLIGVEEVVPIELCRKGSWPTKTIWSLTDKREPTDEDELLYAPFEASFEEDGTSFAFAKDDSANNLVVCFSSGVDLSAVAKLYEVTEASRGQGKEIAGSILVVQEKNRIEPIEAMVRLSSFGVVYMTLGPSWKVLGSN